MERLTKRNSDGSVGIAECRYYNYEDFQKLVQKLADYEDKQEQGLLIELPVPIGGTVWGWEYPTRIDEKDGSTWTICDRRRAKVVPKEFHLMMLDRMGDMYFKTEAEAEEALAKMGGK